MNLLDPTRPRFILDAYAVVNGQAVPLNEAQARKFSTLDQANEVLDTLPAGVFEAKIIQQTVDPEFGELHSNYSHDFYGATADDSSDLFTLAIKCNVAVRNQGPDAVGAAVFNVGEILAQRMLLGDQRNKAQLVLDDLGQLHYRLP